MGIYINENNIKSYKKLKVFLGGTCNNSTWRDELIEKFNNINIDYFNPVVDDWNEEAKLNELIQRKLCDINLYVITSEMTGVYSIAEAVDDSNKVPEKTILCVLPQGFDKDQIHSLSSVGELIRKNGAIYVESLDDVINNITGR